MLLRNPDFPDRCVRLAYCTNLHPADDLESLLAGLRGITLPLAERFDHELLSEGFGVGLWLPASVALALSTDAGEAQLETLAAFMAEERLDPFTFNAFPYGDFHAEGLKEGVFRPTWKAPERLAYTLAMAHIALAIRDPLALRHAGAPADTDSSLSHLSISTHTGMYAEWIESDADRDACAENMALCALHLSQLEAEHDVRILLSLEAEPRSTAGDTRALPGLFERVHARAREVIGRGHESLRDLSEAIVRKHIGSCLDACHAAVEFEEPADAFRNATASGIALGKLQFSSALTLTEPARHADARASLFGLAEPVYLHQVTGRGPEGLQRASDLPELERAWNSGDARWQATDEWRCHFHVPVDLDALGHAGLTTTRAQADATLTAVLAAPERWSTHELHVEIETYTWNLLPKDARGSGDWIDGLEREYRHVLARLSHAGWHPAKVSRKPTPRVDSPPAPQ